MGYSDQTAKKKKIIIIIMHNWDPLQYLIKKLTLKQT